MEAGLRIRRFVLGELETNCWVVDDGEGGPLLVIDPAGEPEVLLAAIGDAPVAAVVLTHGHFDHLAAATAVVEATGAPLAVHSLDAPAITSAAANGAIAFGWDDVSPEADRLLEDGDVVEGGGARLSVLHTPGHTIGSICLLSTQGDVHHLFSGDTLFAGSVGRSDLPGGDARALRESIRALSKLPPGTFVHPGHGPETTLRHEARVNFFWPKA